MKHWFWLKSAFKMAEKVWATETVLGWSCSQAEQGTEKGFIQGGGKGSKVWKWERTWQISAVHPHQAFIVEGQTEGKKTYLFGVCQNIPKGNLGHDSMVRWSNQDWAQNAKCCIWRKSGLAHHLMFFSSRDWDFRRKDQNGSKCRDILEEDLLKGSQNLRLEHRFSFQHDTNSKYTAEICECFWVLKT